MLKKCMWNDTQCCLVSNKASSSLKLTYNYSNFLFSANTDVIITSWHEQYVGQYTRCEQAAFCMW